MVNISSGDGGAATIKWKKSRGSVLNVTYGGLALDQLRQELMIAEIRMIEEAINRLSGQCFLVKGWALTLVVGTLVLEGGPFGPSLAVLPLLSLWWLDAYLLRAERSFRQMQIWVARNRPTSDESLLELDPRRFADRAGPARGLMVSSTLCCFYGSILLLVLFFATWQAITNGR